MSKGKRARIAKAQFDILDEEVLALGGRWCTVLRCCYWMTV
jgi:hypothetical protein